jgi:hypothetical protein
MSTAGIIVGVICMVVGWVISFYWGAKTGFGAAYELGFLDGYEYFHTSVFKDLKESLLKYTAESEAAMLKEVENESSDS